MILKKKEKGNYTIVGLIITFIIIAVIVAIITGILDKPKTYGAR